MEEQESAQKLKERVSKITKLEALKSFIIGLKEVRNLSTLDPKPTYSYISNRLRPEGKKDGFNSTLSRLLSKTENVNSRDCNLISELSHFFVLHYHLKFDISENDFLDTIYDNEGKVLHKRIKIENTDTEKYLAYYWRANDKIGLATLTIKKIGNDCICNKNCGSFIVHYTEGDRELLCTQIYRTDRYMYIRVENEVTPNLPNRILSQISIALPEADRIEGHYLIGSYTTVHRDGDEAVAGLMVLEKIKDGSENKIHNRDVEDDKIDKVAPEIFYYLYSQRISARKVDKKGFLPFQNELKILEDFVGTYQGYYVNYTTERVSLYKCTISKNGLVVNEYPSQYQQIIGYVKYVNNSVMMIWFDFKEEQYNRFNYILSLPSLSTEDKKNRVINLKGVATGIDKHNENPFSGKFYLKLTDKNEIEIRTLNSSESTLFFQNNTKQEIAQFLLSEDVDEVKYDDSFVRKIYNKKTVKNTFNNLTNEFKGTYEIFVSGRVKIDNTLQISRVDRLSDSGIVRHTLIIEEDGKVILKGENDTINCIGSATILENRKYLQLTLSDATKVSMLERTGDGFEGVIIFSLKSTTTITPNELNHLFGIMIKMDDTRMQGLACILTQVHENTPPISKFYRSMEQTNQNGKTWGFDDFDQVFSKGLLSFLEGASYRVQRLPQTANRPLRPRKKEYRRLYFYSACHLALRMSNNEKNNTPQLGIIDEIELCITEAYKHGFSANCFAGYKINKDLLKQSNKVFFEKFGAKEKYLDELKADFKSLIEDREMLQIELKNVQTFGQPQIYEIVKKLWNDIEILEDENSPQE